MDIPQTNDPDSSQTMEKFRGEKSGGRIQGEPFAQGRWRDPHDKPFRADGNQGSRKAQQFARVARRWPSTRLCGSPARFAEVINPR